MSTSTEIVPAFERGRIALKKTAATLRSVAEAMLDEPEALSTEVMPFPDLAPVLVITVEQKTALNRLGKVFGVVQPDTRRVLTDAEIKALYDEREVLKTIVGLVSSREEAIKTTVRHHMDVTAENTGKANPQTTDRDDAGHYILCGPQKPERVDVPGTDKAFSREFRNGSVSIDGEVLTRLHESGEVSREDYLAFTREVRVFDETKALEAIKKNPERLSLIKRISRRGKPGTSLFVRKAN